MPSSKQLTAAQEILLAAAAIQQEEGDDFSEWDLTVSAWNTNKNRFGCRGYEDEFPDHKRVMMEIMGRSKKDNPLRKGWMEKTKQNHYRVTALGIAESDRLRQKTGEITQSQRSAQPVYDAVAPYIEHSVFRSYCKDSEEPRMWLGAASFLGITRNEPGHLSDRLESLRRAITTANEWLSETQQSSLRRGVTGGGITIRREDIQKLEEFFSTITERFAIQISAIEKQ